MAPRIIFFAGRERAAAEEEEEVGGKFVAPHNAKQMQTLVGHRARGPGSVEVLPAQAK